MHVIYKDHHVTVIDCPACNLLEAIDFNYEKKRGIFTKIIQQTEIAYFNLFYELKSVRDTTTLGQCNTNLS